MKFSKKEIKSDGGSHLYLRVKDGESVNVILRGEIHEFRIKWENGKSIEIPESDSSRMNRFRLNAVIYENGAFVAKLWEFGLTVYNQLSDINDVYPLEKTKIRVSRKGTGTDTTYMLLPMLNEPLSQGALKSIEAVKLNVLNAKPKQESKSLYDDYASPDTPSYDDEPLPF